MPLHQKSAVQKKDQANYYNNLGLSCAKLRSGSKLAYPADLCKEWFQVDILFVCDFRTTVDSMSPFP